MLVFPSGSEVDVHLADALHELLWMELVVRSVLHDELLSLRSNEVREEVVQHGSDALQVDRLSEDLSVRYIVEHQEFRNIFTLVTLVTYSRISLYKRIQGTPTQQYALIERMRMRVDTIKKIRHSIKL